MWTSVLYIIVHHKEMKPSVIKQTLLNNVLSTVMLEHK